MKDWQTKPFVTVSVHDRECPPETEPVFPNAWQGTKYGCLHPDFTDCGKKCYIDFGEGRVEIFNEDWSSCKHDII